MPVREGLARLEGVESISERCNRQAGTGELRLKNGRLVDPNALSKQIADIRVGARLRGLEATVDGFLEKTNGKPVLRVAKSNESLQLAPLTAKVQIDALKTKKPEPPTKDEQKAYKTLLASAKAQPQTARIIGPLRSTGHGLPLKLEVRRFELRPNSGLAPMPRVGWQRTFTP